MYEDVETEQELLQGDLQMLKMLKSPADDKRIVELLEELEYLVAQTDNARTIANLDGWGSIVALLTAEIGAEGQTDDVIRMAAWTIATAVKLDPVRARPGWLSALSGFVCFRMGAQGA